MSINCRPGDLAVVVRAHRTENIGLVVRVSHLDARWLEPVWVLAETVDRVGVCLTDGSLCNGITCCPDEYLRPIRDNDGEDETLTWAGKPESAAIEWALGAERAA